MPFYGFYGFYVAPIEGIEGIFTNLLSPVVQRPDFHAPVLICPPTPPIRLARHFISRKRV